MSLKMFKYEEFAVDMFIKEIFRDLHVVKKVQDLCWAIQCVPYLQKFLGDQFLN